MAILQKPGRRLGRAGALGLVVWVCAAGGALQIADIPGEFGGSLCGVWGCYPPLQALAAMHLFWCVVMAPVVWALVWSCPLHLRRIGVGLAAGAAVVAFVMVGWDLAGWLRWTSEEYRPFWHKRAAYTLLTASDVPLLQTFLAGLACAGLGRGRPSAGAGAAGDGPNVSREPERR